MDKRDRTLLCHLWSSGLTIKETCQNLSLVGGKRERQSKVVWAPWSGLVGIQCWLQAQKGSKKRRQTWGWVWGSAQRASGSPVRAYISCRRAQKGLKKRSHTWDLVWGSAQRASGSPLRAYISCRRAHSGLTWNWSCTTLGLLRVRPERTNWAHVESLNGLKFLVWSPPERVFHRSFDGIKILEKITVFIKILPFIPFIDRTDVWIVSNGWPNPRNVTKGRNGGINSCVWVAPPQHTSPFMSPALWHVRQAQGEKRI